MEENRQELWPKPPEYSRSMPYIPAHYPAPWNPKKIGDNAMKDTNEDITNHELWLYYNPSSARESIIFALFHGGIECFTGLAEVQIGN